MPRRSGSSSWASSARTTTLSKRSHRASGTASSASPTSASNRGMSITSMDRRLRRRCCSRLRRLGGEHPPFEPGHAEGESAALRHPAHAEVQQRPSCGGGCLVGEPHHLDEVAHGGVPTLLRERPDQQACPPPVSYTHLTLPTIYSV